LLETGSNRELVQSGPDCGAGRGERRRRERTRRRRRKTMMINDNIACFPHALYQAST
jgi:hypothetical protein